MKDVMKHIEANGITYPMAFNINIIEVMQEKYGSIDAWVKKISPDPIEKEYINDELETVIEKIEVEPTIKDLIFTYKECINEAIDIENEKTGEQRPFVTEKQVGRILGSLTSTTGAITELVIASNDNGKEKNLMTEQNLIENQDQ